MFRANNNNRRSVAKLPKWRVYGCRQGLSNPVCAVSVDGKLIVGRSDNNGVAASALGRDEEGADTRGSDTTRNSTLSLKSQCHSPRVVTGRQSAESDVKPLHRNQGHDVLFGESLPWSRPENNDARKRSPRRLGLQAITGRGRG
jgi:hypothetical protein